MFIDVSDLDLMDANFISYKFKANFKPNAMLVKFKNLNFMNLIVLHETYKAFRRISTFTLFSKENARIRNYTKSTTGLNENEGSINSVATAQVDNEIGITDDLIKWGICNKISYIAFSRLLKVLSKHGIENLPVSSKALLKAKESEIKVTKVPPGTYTHFGLRQNLTNLILNLIDKNLFNKTEICLSVFIDQLPLVKLTQRNLWVILGSVEGFTNNILFIGAYHGYSRPESSNLFLTEFVTEAKFLSTQGLEINNTRYPVRIQRLICDAPAKAFVLNIKDFSGYSSCTKCNTVGKYTNKKISFLEKSSPRKDEDFEKDEMYVNSKSILLEIPNFRMVSNVVLDYMHLVCLGVVKKLLSIWLSNKKYWDNETSAFDMIKSLAFVYPCEFQKKPKSLKYPRLVATDFREFLLYYGPVALKNSLKSKYYDHFMLLHVACRLLCIEANSENINRGRKMLNDFVENYKNLYKSEQVTHNVHGLYHLADECSYHGTLDSFSAFPFEKFLVNLKNSMKRMNKKSAPQTVLKESCDLIFTKSLARLHLNYHKVGKKLKTSDEEFPDFYHYEKLSLKNFDIIPGTKGDNYVILKNRKIVEVNNILGKKDKSNKTHLVAGREFISVSNFHSEPFEDLNMDMFKVQNLSDAVDVWPVDMIDRKCMKIPGTNDKCIIIGLLDENY